ncbi:MAG: hypothetical protein ACKO2P_10025 [Planctomycetota bacterium]
MLNPVSCPLPLATLLAMLVTTTCPVAIPAAVVQLNESQVPAADDKSGAPDAASKPIKVDQAAQSDKTNKTDKQLQAKSPKTISAEDQTATLDFVREHHPELSHLLEQLQKSRPDEFHSALRELVPQTQAIIRMRDRLPTRYPTQLAAWKRDSQIRLLMARWSRSQDPQIETQVRELIAQRHQDRITELQAEQQRLSEQLRKVEEQLNSQNQNPQQAFDAEWEQLSRRATAAARSAKASAPSKNKILSRPSKKPRSTAPESAPATPPASK